LSYTDRRDALLQRELELRQNVQDVETMVRIMEGGRDRLEGGLASLEYSAEEMKGQIRILKERQTWLIGEVDKLRANIVKVAAP
jgi:hypothetical protein